MGKVITNCLTVPCLLLFTASAVMWVVSYQSILKWSFPSDPPGVAKDEEAPQKHRRGYGIDSYVGTIHLIVSKYRALRQCDSGYYGVPGNIKSDHYELSSPDWTFLGIAWLDCQWDYSAITPGAPLMRYRSLTLPYWVLTSLFGLPAVWLVAKIFARRRRNNRIARGDCVSCGYDLRGSPNQCPECGQPTH